MKKKVVSLLMICALSVGMLAGCGSSETQNQATGSADNTQTAGTETDRKSTRLNSSHASKSRMPSSA